MALLDKRIVVIDNKLPPKRSRTKVNRDVLKEMLQYKTWQAQGIHNAINIAIRPTGQGWERKGLRLYTDKYIFDLPDRYQAGVKQALGQYPTCYYGSRDTHIIGYVETDGRITTYLDYCIVKEFEFEFPQIDTLAQAIYAVKYYFKRMKDFNETEYEELGKVKESPTEELQNRLKKSQEYVQYMLSDASEQVSGENRQVDLSKLKSLAENGQVDLSDLDNGLEQYLKFLPLIFNELVELNQQVKSVKAEGKPYIGTGLGLLGDIKNLLLLNQSGVIAPKEVDLETTPTDEVEYEGVNNAFNKSLVIPNRDFLTYIFDRYDSYKDLGSKDAPTFKAISKELDSLTDEKLVKMRDDYLKSNPQVKNGFSERYLKNLIKTQFVRNSQGLVVRRGNS